MFVFKPQTYDKTPGFGSKFSHSLAGGLVDLPESIREGVRAASPQANGPRLPHSWMVTWDSVKGNPPFGRLVPKQDGAKLHSGPSPAWWAFRGGQHLRELMPR